MLAGVATRALDLAQVEAARSAGTSQGLRPESSPSPLRVERGCVITSAVGPLDLPLEKATKLSGVPVQAALQPKCVSMSTSSSSTIARKAPRLTGLVT